MQQELSIRTHKRKQVVDITDNVQSILKGEGICTVFVLHTTAALTTADLDPGTDLDLLDALEAIAPKLNYRHPHDPAHAPDHILASIIGPSVIVPYKEGRLILGTWQRIVLIELDGPRERTIIVST